MYIHVFVYIYVYVQAYIYIYIYIYMYIQVYVAVHEFRPRVNTCSARQPWALVFYESSALKRKIVENTLVVACHVRVFELSGRHLSDFVLKDNSLECLCILSTQPPTTHVNSILKRTAEIMTPAQGANLALQDSLQSCLESFDRCA